jgi:hypothetical protein
MKKGSLFEDGTNAHDEWTKRNENVVSNLCPEKTAQHEDATVRNRKECKMGRNSWWLQRVKRQILKVLPGW